MSFKIDKVDKLIIELNIIGKPTLKLSINKIKLIFLNNEYLKNDLKNNNEITDNGINFEIRSKNISSLNWMLDESIKNSNKKPQKKENF